MSALPFRKLEDGKIVAEPSSHARFGPASALAIPGVVPASRLEVQPAPDLVPTGIAAVDALTGGLPRGALTEIVGATSSGRTSLLISVLAGMTARGEVCALVDACDSFAPECAQSAGVQLAQVLWVRCDNPVSSFKFRVSSKTMPTRNPKPETRTYDALEQALKATDLLLQSGGFGLVAVDLGDIPVQAARRVPLTSWFRFRRAVENTPTVLLLLARESCAKTCASVVIQLRLRATGDGLRPERATPRAQSLPSHAELLTGMSVEAELVRARMERKPVRAASADFETRAQWA